MAKNSSAKRNTSAKDTPPVKGIKPHGIMSLVGFILIIVAGLIAITHPGQIIFGLISFIGFILNMAFELFIAIVIIGCLAFLFFKFFF